MNMIDHQESIKWEGEIIEEIKSVTPQQLWSLIQDFGSLDKLFSHVDKCYIVEGVQGEPGVIRCCESTTFSGGTTQYAKERLIMIDQSKMCLSYEILDNSIGLTSYVATMRLFPIDDDDDDDDDDGKCGCKFVWTFVADPIQGFTKEGFVESLKAIAKGMATRVVEIFS